MAKDQLLQYREKRFAGEELLLDAREAGEVAVDFWPSYRVPPQHLTERDRAFIQAALMAAIDASFKAGISFDLLRAFYTKAPTGSLKKVVRSFLKKAGRRFYAHWTDKNLSVADVSAVGRAAIQYSWFSTEWRLRVSTQDDSMLTDFLSPTPHE